MGERMHGGRGERGKEEGRETEQREEGRKEKRRDGGRGEGGRLWRGPLCLDMWDGSLQCPPEVGSPMGACQAPHPQAGTRMCGCIDPERAKGISASR